MGDLIKIDIDKYPGTFQTRIPFHLENGGELLEIEQKFGFWGKLNPARTNAVVICGGISATINSGDHPGDPDTGWWRNLIGSGKAIDTDKYFVISIDPLGGSFGSTSPASIDPQTGTAYNANFPIISVQDIVRAEQLVLDALGVGKVKLLVGISMGGMMVLEWAALGPHRFEHVLSICASAKSYPQSIASRYSQRLAIMLDPKWKNGNYSKQAPPVEGLTLARMIGNISYRSHEEWNERFADNTPKDNLELHAPNLDIESYLHHISKKQAHKLDANSFIVLSNAINIYNIGRNCNSFADGVLRIKCPITVVGVNTDILFPQAQQEEIAQILMEHKRQAKLVIIDSPYGHDTFLIDHKPFVEIIAEILST